jgi:hypothetical protein
MICSDNPTSIDLHEHDPFVQPDFDRPAEHDLFVQPDFDRPART